MYSFASYLKDVRNCLHIKLIHMVQVTSDFGVLSCELLLYAVSYSLYADRCINKTFHIYKI